MPQTDPAELWQAAIRLHQASRLDEAVDLYGRLLTTQPQFAPAYGARAVALLSLGRAEAAASDFQRLIGLDPGQADAHSNLGVALARLGRRAEALTSFDRALALKPDFAAAHNNRSETLAALDRPQEAALAAQAALSLQPDFLGAHINLGGALAALGRQEEALMAYQAATAIDPSFASGHFNAGVALLTLKRNQQALEAFDAALAAAPHLAEAQFNRGHALYALGRFEDAATSFAATIALAPNFASAHHNLGKTLQKLRRLEASLAAYERAAGLDPSLAESHINTAFVLTLLGRFDEAMAASGRALAIAPNPVVDNNRAQLHLLRGEFAQGWPLMERRKAMSEWAGAVDCPGPAWLGAEDISGKTLFVHWEQGLGDTLQFCRYLPLAAARGARVVFSCQDALRHLVASLGPPVELIGERAAPDAYDYQTSLLSLPLAFGADLDSIPASPAYLRADAKRSQAWRRRLGEEGFKIGIAWRGSPFGARRGYSFALADLAPLASIPGVRLISLQKLDEAPPQAPMPVEFLGPDFDAGPDAFADSAAVMANLDLVVTPDTAIAHLAGALGVPVWVALHKAPDWRYLLEREDSPWYPTMRLFRQAERDEWGPVFAAMTQALERLRPADPGYRSPVR
ncbi:MAG: glycosyltransferase [Caulobacteraceae bacterium]|nr:glycosyltransferase [Caulobacteraceae bacterium]